MIGRLARAVDDRVGAASWVRKALNHVFPDHWSFMLGEATMYSFLVLVATGVYLTFFYDASLAEVVYDGSYAPLAGTTVSSAYSSVLHLSFDVRGGLTIRQMHHWAALVFLALIVVHAGRIFFTGAFRKPRELNWFVGLTMALLALANGFAGYSLVDDLLSGVRAAGRGTPSASQSRSWARGWSPPSGAGTSPARTSSRACTSSTCWWSRCSSPVCSGCTWP